MADALNRRLHDSLTTAGPTVRCARDQNVGVGDLIMSRSNDSTLPVQAAAGSGDRRPDQVRNGNRWRVKSIDAEHNTVTAQRLSDGATAVFDGEYLREHVTLGYAATVHSAQGVTADRSYAILSKRASRAMLYVAMTRGRDSNQAFIYQRFDGEADHEHSKLLLGDAIHLSERSDKYRAAHRFRAILANDDRPRSMHTEADRVDRSHLPDAVVDVLQRSDLRRKRRDAAWRTYRAAERSWSGRAETATRQSQQRAIGRGALSIGL